MNLNTFFEKINLNGLSFKCALIGFLLLGLSPNLASQNSWFNFTSAEFPSNISNKVWLSSFDNTIVESQVLYSDLNVSKIIKYSPEGDLVWATEIQISNWGFSLEEVEVDSSGNLFIVFVDEADDESEIFKLSIGGELISSVTFDQLACRSIEIFESGNIGLFGGTGSPLYRKIITLDSNLVLLTENLIPSQDINGILGRALISENNFYLAGSYQYSDEFGFSNFAVSVSKMNESGEVLWSTIIDGSGWESFDFLFESEDGLINVIGETNSTDGIFLNNQSESIFWAKLDPITGNQIDIKLIVNLANVEDEPNAYFYSSGTLMYWIVTDVYNGEIRGAHWDFDDFGFDTLTSTQYCQINNFVFHDNSLFFGLKSDYWNGAEFEFSVCNQIQASQAFGIYLYSSNCSVIENSFMCFPSIQSSNSFVSLSPIINGHCFLPNEILRVESDGYYNESFANDFGEFSLEIEDNQNFDSGTIEFTVNGNLGSSASFNLFKQQSEADLGSDDLTVFDPVLLGNFSDGTLYAIHWSDHINFSDEFPPTSNGLDREYNYSILISYDEGNSWETVEAVNGVNVGGEEHNFTRQVLLEEPGNAIIRVENANELSSFDTSEIFEVVQIVEGEVQIELLWDKSKPDPGVLPIGVCADGISRLLVKVSNFNTDLTVESVEIESENWEDANFTGALLLGTFGPVTNPEEYSDEANNFEETSYISTNPNQTEYYFWYKAPSQFSTLTQPNNDPDFKYRELIRLINLNVIVNYSNSEQTSATKTIRVERPPLMMAHGLASGPETWDNFGYFDSNNDFREYIYSPIHSVNRAITLHPSSSFAFNSEKLLFPHFENGFENKNSFISCISEMRNLGYACNQVDYVCHSMGGSVLRYAEGQYPDLFKTNDGGLPWNNYDKGWVNKAIFLNTPHNGSLWSDFLLDFSQAFEPDGILTMPFYIYLLDLSNDEPNAAILNFVTPTTTGIEPTDALLNLQAINQNVDGVLHSETDIPSHLIASDIFMNDAIDVEFYGNQLSPLGNMFSSLVATFVENYINTSSNEDLIDLNQMQEELSGLNGVERSVSLFNFIFETYGETDYLYNSDIIVSLESQLAGMIEESDQTFVDFGISHLEATNDTNLGSKVFELLNIPASLENFSTVPATPIYEGGDGWIAAFNDNSSAMLRSINQIEIEVIGDAMNLEAGTTVSLLVNSASIDEVINCNIYFENRVYSITEIQDSLITIEIPIHGTWLGEQTIIAECTFETFNGICSSVATISTVITTSEDLLLFHMLPERRYLTVGEVWSPEYLGVFNSFISKIGAQNPNLEVLINDESIVQFNSDQGVYEALSPGKTFAIAEFLYKKDTIYFEIGGVPLDDFEFEDETPNNINHSLTSKEKILIWPNPNQGRFYLSDNHEIDLSTVRLSSILGLSISCSSEKSGDNILIETSGKTIPGIYVLQYRAGPYWKSSLLMIE